MLGHEVLDTAFWVVFEDGAECGPDVVDWIDAGHLAGGDEGGEHCPVLGADLIAGKEGILPCQGNRPDLVLDWVGVEFEGAIIEEADQARPVCEGIADILGQQGFLRDA